MAIRFFDTGFFKSPFVRGIKAPLKTLYCFIICDCSGAGIWVKDLEAASLYIGTKVTENDFKVFIEAGKAIDLNDGKIFFPDFIEHQYPQGLQEHNRAHKNFIQELKKYNLIDEKLKPLSRPFKGSPSLGNSHSQGKGHSLGNSKGLGNEAKSEIVYPFDSEIFRGAWSEWKAYKKTEHKFSFKSEKTEQRALKELSELAGNQETAIKIINRSIANGWKGLFKLDNNGKESRTLQERFEAIHNAEFGEGRGQ